MKRTRGTGAFVFNMLLSALVLLVGTTAPAQGMQRSSGAGEVGAAMAAGSGAGHVAVLQPAGTAQIRGIKYHDRDYDGMMETGEEGLAGWTMVLSSASRPGWVETTTTGATGAFAFTGLPAATYSITEVAKPGWHNTNGLPHVVTVRDGQIASTENEIGAVQDHAEVTLIRGASPLTFRSVGQVIRFTYTLRNTGNVGLLPPFVISDDKVAVKFPAIERLVPRADVSFAASYTVTQADVNAGFVRSAAVVRVDGFLQSNTATVTCTLDRPVDTSLLISASHYGRRRHQQVTVYTRLKADVGAQFTGCQVLFQVKRPGSSTWTTVATRSAGTTTGKASYRTTLHSRGTYQWRAKFGGMGRMDAATSRTILIKVSR